MFSITSKNSGVQSHPPSSIADTAKPALGGTYSKAQQQDKNQTTDGFVSTSNQTGTALGPNTNLSSNPITLDLNPLLYALTPQSEKSMFSLYRDMYYHDAICGGSVDMIGQSTFSGGFTLSGADASILNAYEEAVSRLNVKTLLSEMSNDYLVFGMHCSSLLYNASTHEFVDLMCHAPD
jgi:hypothetical protein